MSTLLERFTQRHPAAYPLLLRIAVVVGVVLAGLVIGRAIRRMPGPEILIAAGLLPPAGLLLLHHGRLEHGILGILLAAAAVRFTLPTGTQSRIVMSLLASMAVVGLWLLPMLIEERRLWLHPSPVNLPLLGFVTTCFVSYAWSNVFRDPQVVTWSSWPLVQLGGLAVMILLPGTFLATAQRMREEKYLHWLVVIFLGVGILAALSHTLPLAVDFLQVRPLFPTWFIALAYTQALFNRRLGWMVRLGLLLATGAWLVQVFVREFRWISAWLPALSAILVISALHSRKLLVIVLILLLVYVMGNLAFFQTRIELEVVSSGETRVDAWAHNWRVTGKHLLFGVGPAGYAVYYMTYFPLEAMASHSTYIDVLSQTGIVGLAFFLWFFAALLVVLYRLRRRTAGRGDFAEGFGLAALGGYAGTIVAMALGDWIVPFVYTQTIAGFDYAVYSWLLLGGAVALHRIVEARRETER